MTALAHVGGPLGCLGLALLLVARRRELRLAGLGAWALGALFLALFLAPEGNRGLLAAAAVVGALAAVAGAALLQRLPWLLAFATLVLIPVRIPVSVGSTEATLLVPLYAVIGAAAAALGWQLLRGDSRSRELGPLALPVAAFVGYTGLSLSWTSDVDKGAVSLLFFFLPFGLLALVLARLPWRSLRVLQLYRLLAAMGLLLAVIGIAQYAARDVFWNPKVIVGNAYQPFFRVNSLFWDPSMYGRFLVVAALASLVAAVWAEAPRLRLPAAATVAVTWAGLLFSFSQSSFVSLLVAGAVAGVVLLRPRPAVAAGAAAALAVAVLAAGGGGTAGATARTAAGAGAAPTAVASSPVPALPVADVSGGRGKLVQEGLRIALDNPVAGVGVGGFIRAYADRVGLAGRSPKSAASHTTVVTVAAEGGVIGLALLLWLAVAALALPFRNAGRTLQGRAALVLGLVLLAISVHSFGYNALFEDPTTWVALGLAACVTGAGTAAAGRGAGAGASGEPQQ